jgi:hypothetical protein
MCYCRWIYNKTLYIENDAYIFPNFSSWKRQRLTQCSRSETVCFHIWCFVNKLDQKFDKKYITIKVRKLVTNPTDEFYFSEEHITSVFRVEICAKRETVNTRVTSINLLAAYFLLCTSETSSFFRTTQRFDPFQVHINPYQIWGSHNGDYEYVTPCSLILLPAVGDNCYIYMRVEQQTEKGKR